MHFLAAHWLQIAGAFALILIVVQSLWIHERAVELLLECSGREPAIEDPAPGPDLRLVPELIPEAHAERVEGGDDQMKIRIPRTGVFTPMPFCGLCFRFMTPREAAQHSRHAKAIKWPKQA